MCPENPVHPLLSLQTSEKVGNFFLWLTTFSARNVVGLCTTQNYGFFCVAKIAFVEMPFFHFKNAFFKKWAPLTSLWSSVSTITYYSRMVSINRIHILKKMITIRE